MPVPAANPAPLLRPTLAGTAALYTAVALLGLAAATGDERPLAAASLLVGLLVVSALVTRRAARGISVRRRAPDAAHAGEPFVVAYRVESARRLLPSDGLAVVDALESGGKAASAASALATVATVPPGGAATAEAELLAFRRGLVRFRPLRLHASPAPALFRLEAPLPGTEGDDLLVLPRRGVIEAKAAARLLARASSADLAPVARSLGEDDFRGLRDYRPGDPLRRVHWKLLARFPDRPMVREMEDARVREATLLLETRVERGDARALSRLERALSFAGALAEALLAHGHRVRFRAFGPEPLSVDLSPGRGGAGDLARALALLEPSSDHGLDDLVRHFGGAAAGALFLLAISPPEEAARAAPPGTLVLGPVRMRELMYYAR